MKVCMTQVDFGCPASNLKVWVDDIPTVHSEWFWTKELIQQPGIRNEGGPWNLF
jgi:hypothetical protein